MIKSFVIVAVCLLPFSFAWAREVPASHTAVYAIALDATKGGAAGVVDAGGKMSYSIQKECGGWRTESVFSLDVGREMTGTDTTIWKQTTRESDDGCSFEFEVFVREKGKDRKDLAGKGVCNGAKKVVSLSLPVKSSANFPKSVVFPVQQTIKLLKAAREKLKDVTAYVYDGTRPDSLYSMHAAVSEKSAEKPVVVGDERLITGRKSYQFDAAFYEEFGGRKDGAPLYEVSMHTFDNGVSDRIVQDFGTYRLISTLKEVRALPEPVCR